MPLKKLIKELFTPTDCDNQDRTNVLQKLTVLGIQELLDEFKDDKKATYQYLSISESKFFWQQCPPNVKKVILGKMASNNLAESSFVGVTAQVQCYGRKDMYSADDVSDTARNVLLDLPTTKKQMEGH